MTDAIKNTRLSELDLTGRSFLTIHDFSPPEVTALLDLATEVKAGAEAARAARGARRPRRRDDLHEDRARARA